MNPASNFMYTPSPMAMYPVMAYQAPPPGAQQHILPDTRNGFQEYGVFSESNGILDPIGATAFDPVEELVWSGSQSVRCPSHPFLFLPAL